MKKVMAFSIIGILMFSLLLSSVGVVSADDTLYGKIYPSVELSLGSKVTVGPYTIEFKDTDRYFTTAVLVVSGPEGTTQVFVQEGTTAYYPSQSNPVLAFRVAIWTQNDKPVAYLDILSPLKKVNPNAITLSAGATYNLPVGTLRVSSLTNTSATFTVYLPNNPAQSITLKANQSGGITYSFPNSDFKYSNFVYITVQSVSTKSVTFDVYMPRVAATKITTYSGSGSSSSSSSSSSGTQTVSTTLIYNGVLYTNEKLPITVNSTKYYIDLISVVSTKVSLKVYKGDSVVGVFFVNVGAIQDLKGTPFKILIQRTEPIYNRASLVIYGPENAQVTPILRSADIVATISTVPKAVMLGDDMIIVVSVENKGKGDAYDVTVAAPIPNGFQLVSTTKSWTFKSLPAFTKMPALIYVLKPTKVGKFDIGKVLVKYYDDQSLETGQMKTVYSAPLTNIVVYGVPKLSVSAVAYNGSTTGKYVHAKANQEVTLKFTVSAQKGNPTYEFIKNATLYLVLPKGLQGNSLIKVGDLKAGSSKTVQTKVKVAGQALYNVGAVLVYYDPVGNKHELNLGNLVTINSVPPAVVTKEVKVWPSESEIPSYIGQLLTKSKDPQKLTEELLVELAPYTTNESLSQYLNKVLNGTNSTGLAKVAYDTVTVYYKPSNPWKPLAVIFLLATLVVAGLAYNYRTEADKLRERLEKKKSRRPGGLPKKEETEEKEEGA